MKKEIRTERLLQYYYDYPVNQMSKFEPLWKWIHENGTDHFILTYANIERIAGTPIDHSFLAYKKELTEYGFMVGKISMKEQIVSFERLKS